MTSEMQLEAVIDRVWTCSGRPKWSEPSDAIGGRVRASMEIHLEPEMQ
jgi:hypothetical protein